MKTIKKCVICGQSVNVSEASPEIITCENEICIHVVENSIGLHYVTGEDVLKG